MIVDYFPHYVNDGKTIFILESKFGNDGYSFWFKILEILGKSPKHFFDCRDTYNFNFLLAKTRVSEEKAVEILDLLAGLNAIDGELWKVKILYSENFISNLDAVYNRRDTQPATKKEIIDNINDLSKVLMLTEIPENEDNVNKSTQSREEESKVKKSREEERIVKKWNGFAESNGLAKIVKLTDKRLKKLQKRLTDENFNIEHILIRISESDFLLGKTKDWKVDFDFIIENETNFTIILEGKYNGTKHQSTNETDKFLAKQSAERAIREMQRKQT